MITKNGNRREKDSVFRMLFNEKTALLSLFNAVNNTDYPNPEDLKVTTLENAVYLTIKNDLSCLINTRLGLFEHQSTINPNMPLRYLQYVSDLFERDYITRRIYTKRRIRLPRPVFITFYNGVENQPERKELKLSDLYETEGASGEINLELVSVQLNINPGYNEDLKCRCSLLGEYTEFVERVRIYKKGNAV
ncbi:MAG: Rpn family recombination-promoting nuclease/putative transposase [Lachnospiraceae bacterium]|nr:Rpn family recombination-promoting nuclease/putative transposase [Lachnospiraceae bacterium]